MRRPAFTLVELVVAFGVALLAFLILMSTYGDYTQIYRHQEETMTSARDAQTFLSTFKDEIRGVGKDGLRCENVSEVVLGKLGYPGSPLQFWQEKHVMGYKLVMYDRHEGSVAWTQLSTYVRRVRYVKKGADGSCLFELERPGTWKPSLKEPELEPALAELKPAFWRHVPWPDPEKPKIDFFLVKRRLAGSGEATITYAYYHAEGFPYPPRTLVRIATDLRPAPDEPTGPVIIVIGEGRIREDFWLQPMFEIAAWPLPSGHPTFTVPKRYVHAHAAFEEAEGGRFARRILAFDMRLATNL